MLNTEGNIMFSDFRYSKQSDEGSVTMCGPPEYFAPEVCQQLGHGMGCDFWSLGVVLYEVLFGDTPFTAKTDLDIIAKICRHKRGGLEKSDGVSKKCSNFLEVSERARERAEIKWLQTATSTTILTHSFCLARSFRSRLIKNAPLFARRRPCLNLR